MSDTKTPTPAPKKPIPAEATAAAMSWNLPKEELAAMLGTVRTILFGNTDPVQRFFQLLLTIVRPHGKREGYVTWKKQTDTEKATSGKVKQIGENWNVSANGNTPEDLIQSMIDAAARYYVRSGGVDKGRIPDPVTDRVKGIVADLLRPEGFRDKLIAQCEHLILVAKQDEQQKPTLLSIIGRAAKDDENPRWIVKCSNRDEQSLRHFLQDMKAAKRYVTIKVSKDAEEVTPKAYFDALAAEVEAAPEKEAVNQ